MKFIIPIFILFICFSCNSPSKTQASTQDSVSTNSEVIAEKTQTEILPTEKTEIKDQPIKVGNDKVLFRCSGTEPFWNIEVRKSGILFSNSGEDSTLFAYTEPVSATARPVEYFRTYFLEDQNGNKAQLVAKKSEGCPCSDGMSDTNYEYHISFLYNKMMWEGCGETVGSKE